MEGAIGNSFDSFVCLARSTGINIGNSKLVDKNVKKAKIIRAERHISLSLSLSLSLALKFFHLLD